MIRGENAAYSKIDVDETSVYSPLITSSLPNLSNETADSDAEARRASSSSTLYAARFEPPVELFRVTMEGVMMKSTIIDVLSNDEVPK